jgi:hypothetical protein
MSTNAPLPDAKERYSQADHQALIRYVQELEVTLRELNDESYLRSNHVEIYGNPDAGGRQPLLILRSPDGTRFAVSVDNAGALATTNIGDLGL